MLGLTKILLKIGLTIATPIVLLAGAFYIGKQYTNNLSSTTQSFVESAFIEQTNPTQVPTQIPIPTIKQKIVTESDPIIDCKFTYIGTMKLRRSVCSKSTDCQIEGKWVYYDSVDKCKADQKAVTQVSNNQQQITQTYPPCTIYYPGLNYTYTFYFSPEECAYWRSQASSTSNTPVNVTALPTTATQPTTPQKSATDIQNCKNAVREKYNNLIQGCYIKYGDSSASNACARAYQDESGKEWSACEY